MTLNIEELAIINEAQAKLIHQLMIEKMALEHKLEQREYNRRFTNTKHLRPTFTALPNVKPITYIQEETKTKGTSKK